MGIRAPGRLALLAAAAIGASGCGRSGADGAADVDRTVQMPTHDVYHAFSQSVPSTGTQTLPGMPGPDGVQGPLRVRTDKELDKSIALSVETASAGRLLAIRLRFDPLKDGAATEVRGDIDINPILFAGRPPGDEKNAREEVKVALNRAIDQLAAGRPLMAMNRLPTSQAMAGNGRFGSGDSRPAESNVGRDYAGEGTSHIPMSGGRVIPMQSGRPMLDPEAVARQHRFPDRY